MKHRQVKHFGYEFMYTNNNIDKDRPLQDDIPAPCFKVLSKLINKKYLQNMPDQLTVNQYLPGQGNS